MILLNSYGYFDNEANHLAVTMQTEGEALFSKRTPDMVKANPDTERKALEFVRKMRADTSYKCELETPGFEIKPTQVQKELKFEFARIKIRGSVFWWFRSEVDMQKFKDHYLLS